MSNRISCPNCHTPLAPTHTGPCPTCGDTRRLVDVNIVEPPIPVHDEIHRVHTHKSEKKRLIPLMITVGLTVVGAFIASIPDTKWLGIVISLIFGGASIYTGKYAFEKETTIDRA